MRLAGELAQKRGQKLYLVGGVVRDLLLGRRNFDLDLVVEGDAIALASELANEKQGKLVTHQRFGTAKLTSDAEIARFENLTPTPVQTSVKNPANLLDSQTGTAHNYRCRVIWPDQEKA